MTSMRLPVISGSELLKIFHRHFGFYPLRQKGDHVTITNDRIFITVPLHRELDVGTLKSILEDAGITRGEFLRTYKK